MSKKSITVLIYHRQEYLDLTYLYGRFIAVFIRAHQ
jgi:hypothetical protein